MPCEVITITVSETVENVAINITENVENITIVVKEFSIGNIISTDPNNAVVQGTDGGLFVPEGGGVESVNSIAPDVNGNVSLTADNIPETGTRFWLTSVLKSAYDAASLWVVTNGANVANHLLNMANPHNVTKTQVGLGNVVNLDTSTTVNINDSTDKRFVTDDEKTKLSNTIGTNSGDETTVSIQSKRPLKTIEGQSLEGAGNIDLAKGDVGLGNVDNTSDLNKPVSNATATALSGLIVGYMRFISPPFTALASTSFYFAEGNQGLYGTVATSNASRRVTAMTTGVFRKAHIAISAGIGAGPPNAVTVHLDNITQGTSVQITNSLSAAGNVASQNVVINLAVTIGDLITLRLVTPAFSTNPTNFNIYCDLTIEK